MKLKINFYPDSGDPKILQATKEYQLIWKSEGEKIIKTINKITGLKFKAKFFNIIVFEGMSHSFPLRLRASYPNNVKTAALIHETCHRLLTESNVDHFRKDALEQHKELYLVLYDIWEDLYGEKWANENVLVESKRQEFYKQAFDWALSMDQEQRQDKFKETFTKK